MLAGLSQFDCVCRMERLCQARSAVVGGCNERRLIRHISLPHFNEALRAAPPHACGATPADIVWLHCMTRTPLATAGVADQA